MAKLRPGEAVDHVRQGLRSVGASLSNEATGAGFHVEVWHIPDVGDVLLEIVSGDSGREEPEPVAFDVYVPVGLHGKKRKGIARRSATVNELVTAYDRWLREQR